MTETDGSAHQSEILREGLLWQREGGIHSKQGGIFANREVLAALALGLASSVPAKTLDFILRVKGGRDLLQDFKLRRNLIYFRRNVWQGCRG